jgi:hypothetical protein
MSKRKIPRPVINDLGFKLIVSHIDFEKGILRGMSEGKKKITLNLIDIEEQMNKRLKLNFQYLGPKICNPIVGESHGVIFWIQQRGEVVKLAQQQAIVDNKKWFVCSLTIDSGLNFDQSIRTVIKTITEWNVAFNNKNPSIIYGERLNAAWAHEVANCIGLPAILLNPILRPNRDATTLTAFEKKSCLEQAATIERDVFRTSDSARRILCFDDEKVKDIQEIQGSNWVISSAKPDKTTHDEITKKWISESICDIVKKRGL